MPLLMAGKVLFYSQYATQIAWVPINILIYPAMAVVLAGPGDAVEFVVTADPDAPVNVAIALPICSCPAVVDAAAAVMFKVCAVRGPTIDTPAHANAPELLMTSWSDAFVPAPVTS